MGLYQKHRPKTFDEVKGNRDVVASLKAMLKDKETMPHSFLFHGGTGTGKTTLARIIANELGCTENNIIEIDTAQFRGIDTIRDLRKNAQYTPLGGGDRVYIIDECFAKGTQITMQDNSKKLIEDIIVGDIVKNLHGTGKVRHVFKNEVILERVLQLSLSNGKTITCSEDHEFMTINGWLKAKDLENNFVYLQNSCNLVCNTNLLNKQIYEKRNASMPDMPNIVCLLPKQKGGKQQKSMQQEMCRYIQCTKQSRQKMDGTSETKRFFIKKSTFVGNRKRETNSESTFKTNENSESFIQSKNCTKNFTNKEIEWNIACLERGKRWKREINTTTNIVSSSIRLVDGGSNLYGAFTFRQFRVSPKLQSRYREYEIKIGNRSRWQGAQLEKSKIKRLEKGKQVKPIRVESITFYQRGNNDKLFSSIITDKERNQGFVTFYDFEVDTHHSYYANGVLVHNCHKITSDAQNAFLKILEDTPKHVFFILCTTDPQSLLPTIKGRCSQFQTSVLSNKLMGELLLEVAEKEGVTIDDELIKVITESSQGHPRNALTILEQVLQVPEKRRLKAAKIASEEKSESIALCRALMYKKGWKEIAVILKGLKTQDPESIRRVVLGYATSVLLNKDNEMAYYILECFEEPTYNIGFPGIVLACQRVLNYE